MQSRSFQQIASEAPSHLPKPKSTAVQLEMGVECVSGSRIGTFERVREQEMLVFPTVWKKVDSTLSSSRFESWRCRSVHSVDQLNVTSRGHVRRENFVE